MAYGKTDKQIHTETHTHYSAHVLPTEKSRKRNTGSPRRLQSWKLECGVGRVGFMGLYLSRGSYACVFAHTQHTTCYMGFLSVGWCGPKTNTHTVFLWGRCSVVATVKAPTLTLIATQALLHPDIRKALPHSSNTSSALNLPTFDGKSEKCRNWLRHSSVRSIKAVSAILKLELGHAE